MLPADASDLTALIQRYERPLVRYAFSILHELESARDVVQETFIRLVREEKGREELERNPRHLEAWLFTVCRHRALDHQRKYARIIPIPVTQDDRVDEEPCPATSLERRDTADSLSRLLETLTPTQREVVRLKFQNDLSYKEIAEITQLSVTNIGFILHTSLKRLRQVLQASPGLRNELPIPAAAAGQA